MNLCLQFCEHMPDNLPPDGGQKFKSATKYISYGSIRIHTLTNIINIIIPVIWVDSRWSFVNSWKTSFMRRFHIWIMFCVVFLYSLGYVRRRSDSDLLRFNMSWLCAVNVVQSSLFDYYY